METYCLQCSRCLERDLGRFSQSVYSARESKGRGGKAGPGFQLRAARRVCCSGIQQYSYLSFSKLAYTSCASRGRLETSVRGSVTWEMLSDSAG